MTTKSAKLAVSITVISTIILIILRLSFRSDFKFESSEKQFSLSTSKNENSLYDLTREDSLLVFLHIQKTGGTVFGIHLLKDIEGFSCPCALRSGKKRRHCECYHPGNHQLWYFSRYTRGWICGVHPDYTTLIHCLPNLLERKTEELQQNTLTGTVTDKPDVTPNYLYVTLLRDPIHRYLSEYRHTKLGAKWPLREAQCKHGKFYLDANVKQQNASNCFPDGAEDWKGVTLDEFMECELNPAANRMAKMLADLTSIKCNEDLLKNKEIVDEMMLQSAKSNLEKFAYFGLTEFQRESQGLFEKTFGISFTKEFEQQETNASKMNLTSNTEARLQEINYLDMELYRWAKELFLSRL
ncbi:Heparan-sulfate 6-O-sulfotransferase 2 [Oopsacas minuta]|uniref:Heparan-sulfate 6-O-sulfotransferase n=1 Tax=Oopsacas minuta TaxID=111878 RepID=A0AAV7JQ56_9METZ|nr:Heparan-sulfate 6-O-sulfotransferase 2 [Oopsacas minuta]